MIEILRKHGCAESREQVSQERESGLTTLAFTAPEAMDEMENECKWRMFDMVRSLAVPHSTRAALSMFFSEHT